MIPPTTTGASTPRSRSRRTVSGTSSRCEPERIDSPTTSTSSSPAAAAICSGVNRMPWYTTSMPASRAATAICSAPLECPSRPGLPTSTRIGPPSSRAADCTCSRTFTIASTGAAATAPTPVGARYSPNTSRNAPAHSPTVPPALASSMVAAVRFSSVAATRRTPSRARVHAWSSRCDRHCSRCSTCSASRSEEHTSELQSPCNLVCRLLLEKKKEKSLFHVTFLLHQHEACNLSLYVTTDAPGASQGERIRLLELQVLRHVPHLSHVSREVTA